MATTSSALKGGLLLGRVMHRRLQPLRRAFHYRTFSICFDLDDLSRLQKILSRFSPLRFHSRDHGKRDGSVLSFWVREIFAQQQIEASRFVLVTYPRLWGYVFNPVSFWLGLDEVGRLRGVLAEVNNTFGEHHSYLLAHDDRRAISKGDWLVASKAFHVSPFLPVEGQYRFRFHLEDQAFQADIHYLDANGAPCLITQIAGQRRDLSISSVWRAVLQQPFMTFSVVFFIHWQAIRLWRAHIPFHKKPEPPQQEISL